MTGQKFTSQNAIDYVREQISEFEPYWQEHIVSTMVPTILQWITEKSRLFYNPLQNSRIS